MPTTQDKLPVAAVTPVAPADDAADFSRLNKKIQAGLSLTPDESSRMKQLMAQAANPATVAASVPVTPVTQSDYDAAKATANPPAPKYGTFLQNFAGLSPASGTVPAGGDTWSQLGAQIGNALLQKSPPSSDQGVDAVSAAAPSLATPTPASTQAVPKILQKSNAAPDAISSAAPRAVNPTSISAPDPDKFKLDSMSSNAKQASQTSGIDWDQLYSTAKKLGIGVLSLLNAFAVGYAGKGQTPEYIRKSQLAEAQKNRDLETKKLEMQNNFTMQLAAKQAEYAMTQAAAQHGYDLANLTQQQVNDLAKIAAQGDVNKQLEYIQWYGQLYAPGRSPSVSGMYGSTGGR